MRSSVVLILLALTLTGCSTLMPKKVEFGQDKVEKFPGRSLQEIEIQRRAADAADREVKRLVEDIFSGSNTNLVHRVAGIAVLTDALSDSLGPPVKKSDVKPEQLAEQLGTTTAQFIDRIREFRDENDKNAGKKIEGTGKIKVPYFIYVGGMFVFAIIAFVGLKIGLGILKTMNPGVALGLNAVEMGGRALSKAFSQTVKGGKKFIGTLDQITDDSELQAKIAKHFKAAHKESHDEDTRKAIDHLTKD